MNSKYFKHVNYCFEGFPLVLVSTQKLISEGVLGNVAKAAIGTGLTVGAGLALANPEGFSGVIDSAKTAGQGALNSVKSFGQNAYNTVSSWFGDSSNGAAPASGSTPQTQPNPGTNKGISQPPQAPADTSNQPTQPKTNVQPQTPSNTNAQQPQQPQPKPTAPASGSTPPTQANAQPTQQKSTESFMDTAKKAAVTGGMMVAAGGVAHGARQAINATTNVMNRPQRDKQQSNQQQTQRVAYA